MRHGREEAPAGRWLGGGPAGGAERGLGVVRAAAAGGGDRQGRDQPSPIPIGCRSASRSEEGRRAIDPDLAVRWPGEDRSAPAEGRGDRGGGDRTRRRGSPRGRRPPRADRGARPMSAPVLALISLAGGVPDRGSLEAMSLARRLARDTGGPLEVVL